MNEFISNNESSQFKWSNFYIFVTGAQQKQFIFEARWNNLIARIYVSMRGSNEHVPIRNDASRRLVSVDLHARVVTRLKVRLLRNAFAYSWLTYVHIKHRIIRELCPVCTSMLLFFLFFCLVPFILPLKVFRLPLAHMRVVVRLFPPLLVFLLPLRVPPWKRATNANVSPSHPNPMKYIKWS